MALSGSVSAPIVKNSEGEVYNELVFEWTAVQDKATRTSTINWVLKLVAYAMGRINMDDIVNDWHVTIAGTAFTGEANVTIEPNTSKILADSETANAAVVINHSNDDAHTFDFSFSQDMFYTSSTAGYIGTISGSGTGELDPIVEKYDILGHINGYIMAICGRARKLSETATGSVNVTTAVSGKHVSATIIGQQIGSAVRKSRGMTTK